MQSRFDFRSPLTLCLLGVSLFVVFGALWWTQVYMGPKRVFADMLVNNLVTTSVTKNELVGSSSQTSLQRASLQFGAQNIVQSLATVKSSAGSATTETLSTGTATYVRYLSITEAQKQHDFSKVINVWAKADKNSSSQLTQLFTQTVLDASSAPVPPLGNVSSGKRADLLAYMKTEEVFKPDYSQVKTEVINGRKAYVYNVAVKLAPYLRMMQGFSHAYGLTDLDNINPNDYQSSAPIQITVAVDRLSHQMVRVSKADNGFNETYTDYGIARPITLPQKTITTTELGKRLSALQ